MTSGAVSVGKWHMHFGQQHSRHLRGVGVVTLPAVDRLGAGPEMLIGELRRLAIVAAKTGLRNRCQEQVGVCRQMGSVARSAAVVIFHRWVDDLARQLLSDGFVARDAKRAHRS
jgi:hypothetical protein